MGKFAKFVMVILSILTVIVTIFIINDIIAESKNPGQRAARIADNAEKKAAERKASYKATIKNVDDKKHKPFSVITYMDSESSVGNVFKSLWALNDYVCNHIFAELKTRMDEITHENIVIVIGGKDMQIRDDYGKRWKENRHIATFVFFRHDIEQFHCDAHPDVFVAAQGVEFKEMGMDGGVIKDCKKRISEGHHSDTQLCRFL